MSRSTRPSLARKTGNISGLAVVSRRTPNVVAITEKAKNTPYVDFLDMLKRSGSTSVISEEELRSGNPFVIYEKAWGGSESYFMSPTFNEDRRKEVSYLESMIRGSSVVEGIIECPKCTKTRVSKVPLSIRSGDEPDVIRCTCMTCSHQWPISK